MKRKSHSKIRASTVPYMTGEIVTQPVFRGSVSMGYDDLKHDTLKLDGPLVPSMRELIKKYGIPPEALFGAIIIPAAYSCYMLGASMMILRQFGLIP